MTHPTSRVSPFRGVRYNSEVVNDLNQVVCPPYDVISPEDRVYYHKIHDCNFVRLVLGEEFESDSSNDNRFTRARSYLDKWLADGALCQDDSPAMYVYRQDFNRDETALSITGLICAVKMHEYQDNVILPHENTLARPKSQLAELIRQVKANLDSVYGLYEDPKGDVQHIIDKVTSGIPAIDVTDKDGVQHRVWIITDTAELAGIVTFFEDKQIAIADGHHRYETTLAYSKEARESLPENKRSQPLESDYVLMTLANVYQDDLTVLPTHRVMFGLSDESLADFNGKLNKKFNVTDTTREKIVQDMAENQAIGVYLKNRAFIILPKDGVKDAIPGCDASKNLEVNVLHRLVIEELLGLSNEDMRNQTNVFYTRDVDEAVDAVDSGKAQLAFLLNPVGVKAVMDIASAGEKMPQKSTYFYPKLLSGMVLRLLER